MKGKKSRYDYSSIFRCFKLYEYMYECAKQELDIYNSNALVSDRSERLVIDYPDKFIKKYFPPHSHSCSDEDMREMLYGVLRSKRLSILMWTDDNRTLHGAGKDTIHIIKPDYCSERTPVRNIQLLIKNIEWEALLEQRLKHARRD